VSVFRFDLAPGPYGVGLSVIEQYDRSRAFEGRTRTARPLQTLLWYPAECGRVAPMTVADYVNLWASETTFESPTMPARAQAWIAGMKATLALPLCARRDVPRMSGRFPVSIYAPSNSAPSWENADLCEYLASHGYVVLASPCMGAEAREMTLDLPGIDAQARDIAFLIDFANTLPNTDVTAVAAIGFSWGGLANVFAAARDGRLRALICLDGSLRSSPGLVQKAADVQPERMTIPLLSVAQGQWTPEDQDRWWSQYPEHAGPSVLNAWTHGDLVSVYMLGLSHMEHSAMYQRNEDAWQKVLHVYGQKRADYGRVDGIVGYAWIARYALQFLNAYLKGDAAAMTFLKTEPSRNGAPRHFIASSYRAAVPLDDAR